VSGANLSEVTLNSSNVGLNTFGKIFTLPVNDAVFAQPLYVPGVVIPGQGTHNVVYVATMSDTLYAFDADTGGAPLWSITFGTPVAIANWVFMNNQNIVGNLGILSTPVIDPSTRIMYLIDCTLEDNTLAYRLHAVDISTGTEPFGPVLISGTYGDATFDARYQTQRVSLALSGDQVVFAFGAMELEYAGGYSGWVMGYDKSTLEQTGAFATATTGGQGGGVWQSGRPPVVDSLGYVYVFVGNGYNETGYDGVNNFSESALKLDPANGMKLVNWFTPDVWSSMDANDQDLSSSGPLLIPGTNVLAGGGKTTTFYLLDTGKLGKFNATDSQVLQELPLTVKAYRGGPVIWKRSAANGGSLLYNWGVNDSVKAFAFSGTQLATAPSSQGTGAQLWPGGILALSANGQEHGSGILWATVVTSGNAEDDPPVPGELHAFNAENVSIELWNSEMNATRDGFGNFGKLVPPLIANGKVYVATWSDQVAVYGLLSTYSALPATLPFGNQTANVASAPLAVTVTNTGSIALPITGITLSTLSPHPFSQTNNCGTSVAAGSSCQISVIFNPTSAGAKTAKLSINTSGSAGTQTVALTGTGVTAPYKLSSTSLSFGAQAPNVPSQPMTVTVTNTGTTALAISSITLSIKNPPHPFSQTNNCGTSVAAGSSCQISVVFDPSGAGTKSATLSINAGGGAGTQAVALSGTGT
jgi:hypothetical protein